MRKLILPICVFIIAFFACKKESIESSITATGELIDSGSPALDGAGFFIRLENNEELKPDRLPDSLEVPGIRAHVELTYKHTRKIFPSSSCSSCPGMPIIQIISIRKI